MKKPANLQKKDNLKPKQTIRNFFPPVFLVILIFLLYSIVAALNQQYETIKSEKPPNYFNDTETFDFYYAQAIKTHPLQDKLALYLVIIGIVILITSIYFILQRNYGNKDLKKMEFATIIVAWGLVIISPIMAFLYDGSSGLYKLIEGKGDGVQFITLFAFFLPLIYLTYKHSIVGVTIDNTAIINQNKRTFLDDSKTELDRLLKLQIIDENEYSQKVRKLREIRLRDNIHQNEEFHLLKSLKDKDLLTNEEFEIKLQNLIDKKIQEDNTF